MFCVNVALIKQDVLKLLAYQELRKSGNRLYDSLMIYRSNSSRSYLLYISCISVKLSLLLRGGHG